MNFAIMGFGELDDLANRQVISSFVQDFAGESESEEAERGLSDHGFELRVLNSEKQSVSFKIIQSFEKTQNQRDSDMQ